MHGKVPISASYYAGFCSRQNHIPFALIFAEKSDYFPEGISQK
jgi:hypothetical protein